MPTNTEKPETDYPLPGKAVVESGGVLCFEIPAKAVVLRPWRFGEEDEPIHFTGAIFKRGAAGVELFLRRMGVFSMLVSLDLHDSDYALDLMSEDGEILESLAITKRGFEHCRRKLRAVKEA